VSIALAFGISGAFFMTKVRFPGKGIFRALVMLPFVLPGIIMGLTLLIFIRSLNIKLSILTILMGHVSFTTPIVMFQISSRIQRMGPSYQMAAYDLGATPVKTFWYVTLPMIKTALIGASLLAFTVSFDEIIISYFLTGTWMTLPVYLYGMLRFGLSPKVFAISTFILVLSLSLIILMSKFTGRSGEAIRVKR
jgi:spermidine/putrescine transport system permease protein